MNRTRGVFLHEAPRSRALCVLHCQCWFDGKACCACGAPAMTDAEHREQGMEPDGEDLDRHRRKIYRLADALRTIRTRISWRQSPDGNGEHHIPTETLRAIERDIDDALAYVPPETPLPIGSALDDDSKEGGR